ncbi:hypothetical protein RW1_009_00420 [Rhodococcus wratislaviensis NBRC 100605]|uniref:Uncharacterized protein n=1 Tax=Rhodococcus wratislaviensis NBRC 100605 TaxID=1219028 RepID=X0PMD8_RHOWR|nr:hypothetical protein RW1_009_00420 [Rhodococcus wratislaviensis NBRC 100605]
MTISRNYASVPVLFGQPYLVWGVNLLVEIGQAIDNRVGDVIRLKFESNTAQRPLTAERDRCDGRG